MTRGARPSARPGSPTLGDARRRPVASRPAWRTVEASIVASCLLEAACREEDDTAWGVLAAFPRHSVDHLAPDRDGLEFLEVD